MYQSFELVKIRKEYPHYNSVVPFQHQHEAFEKLTSTFNSKPNEHKSGIVVLPTGAGKTFTAVKWLITNVLKNNVKILWLAHTGHLLEQAFHEFKDIIIETPNRQIINMRVVSSDPNHSKASQIDISDDILIMTTQTAISNFNTDSIDSKGKKIITPFEKFLSNSNNSGLFLVLDEAHHAPAFGCRNLLIGGSKYKKGIKQLVNNSNFLGLTATPTYSDNSRVGWLWEIFKNGIIYVADKASLTKQNILAVPEYIQKETNIEYEVDDKAYNQIIREHKDLPEEIIDKLAHDNGRNDYIINEYVKNSKKYGKTLIFADRWYQCIYLKEKLLKNGIKAGSVFSQRDREESTADKRNKSKESENSKTLADFKSGKLDVLINVKMLTEGTNVPDVNTVFITRQTTSSILLTQMIGRGLRGKKAGGGPKKDTANIVFFVDNWRRIINFAIPTIGEAKEDAKRTRGYYPIEYISIKLVEDLARKLDSGINISTEDFLTNIPVGWYETESIVISDGDTVLFSEFVIVYENTIDKFKRFINEIPKSLSILWEDESTPDEKLSKEAIKWVGKYFDIKDNINNNLDYDLIKIGRHYAQKKTEPKFISFVERDSHDLSKLAFQIIQNDLRHSETDDILTKEYNSPDKLWREFYKDIHKFTTAFDSEKNRAMQQIKYGATPKLNIEPPKTEELNREPTEEDKEKVFKSDNYTCQCCGFAINPKSKRQLKKIQIDHISAYKFSGDSTIHNLQTLCAICNKNKKTNEINFRIRQTSLRTPKDFSILEYADDEDIGLILKRSINFFYHCGAVLEIKASSDGRSPYSIVFEVELHKGNNIEWINPFKDKIIDFCKNEFHLKWIKNIKFK